MDVVRGDGDAGGSSAGAVGRLPAGVPVPGSGGRRAVYVISVVAELTGVHPQTLRSYERHGLLFPARSPGGVRRYSDADVSMVLRVCTLTSEGVSLEGVRRILALEAEVSRLTAALAASLVE